MRKPYAQVELTQEQEAEAQRIERFMLGAAQNDIQQLARLLASKKDHELLGQTEYEVRDIVHRIGAQALESVANERSKKGIPR